MTQNGATLQPPMRQSIGPFTSRLAPPPTGIDPLVKAALDSAPVGLIVLDPDLTVRMLTANAAKLLGCGAGLPVRSAMAEMVRCSPVLDPVSAELLMSALGGRAHARETVVTVQTRTGGTIAADIRAADDLGWVLSLSDVTQTRRTQDWLLEHVSSDPVTGLWNRQRFMLMLQDAVSRSATDTATAWPCTVLIGLDLCRPAVDPSGLHAGDMLFRMASERLSGLLSDTDMFARFSENEFAVALTCPDGRAGIEGFCARVQEAFSRPFSLDGHVSLLGCTIGVACAPDDGDDSEQLMAHARLALDAACAAMSGPVRFFEPDLLQRAQHRRSLEAELREALRRHEFELHYQPQVDVVQGRVTGMEALIRWRNPERGLVPPIDFIPLAEQIGMIDEIGTWVLNEACRQAVSWPDDMTVAVNASPLQFETGRFARAVADVLRSTGLPPHRLEVEITENLLLQDTGEVMSTLAALHALGVRLVLDDFGTGYASLSQLSRFKFDKIKIDRSFVSPDDDATQNSVIVRSIAALGFGLGIPITAEGVETVAQLDQIKADGCTCVQGYYFSRPVPVTDIEQMLYRLHRPQA